MKILEKTPVGKEKIWGKVVTCDWCRAKFQIEQGDRVTLGDAAYETPHDPGGPYFTVTCPNCRGKVSRAY